MWRGILNFFLKKCNFSLHCLYQTNEHRKSFKPCQRKEKKRFQTDMSMVFKLKKEKCWRAKLMNSKNFQIGVVDREWQTRERKLHFFFNLKTLAASV